MGIFMDTSLFKVLRLWVLRPGDNNTIFQINIEILIKTVYKRTAEKHKLITSPAL